MYTVYMYRMYNRRAMDYSGSGAGGYGKRAMSGLQTPGEAVQGGNLQHCSTGLLRSLLILLVSDYSESHSTSNYRKL